MKILQLDKNHPLIAEQLQRNGFQITEDHTSTYTQVLKKINDYDGIIIRSRIPLDKEFLQKARHLKFIARVGAGMENIDTLEAENQNILLINSPEGNRDAVAEHALGMLLSLMNRLFISSEEVKKGIWRREENRGDEIKGKTVGLIGYGNMGKSFAKKLRGFDCSVICYDILPNKGDENAKQVTLVDFFRQADVVSLHTPQTPQTIGMVNEVFINSFAKSFWFLNTARGKSVVTDDLVRALQSGKVLGAGLDVLEYEKASFEDFFSDEQMPQSFKYLLEADNVILTPHIAGWTLESKEKLAQIIVDKIIDQFAWKIDLLAD